MLPSRASSQHNGITILPWSLVCNITLVIIICVSTTAAVVLGLMLLCYIFHVPWYIKATYQIIRAKYRAHKEGSGQAVDYTFHAFISYSHADADWVRNQLLPCLENSKPSYRLCIHERDFTPGKWIIDNIIDNIEDSRKVCPHTFIFFKDACLQEKHAMSPFLKLLEQGFSKIFF